MKNVLIFITKVLVCSMAIFTIACVCPRVYADTIYTKDGREIMNAKITEITSDTVWYEVTSGDITESTGMDITDIEKITKNNGSTYSLDGAE
ncbi:MAG: hypothetical protein ABIH85_08770 [Candidatus Omnitrophota bacterium]